MMRMMQTVVRASAALVFVMLAYGSAHGATLWP
jgi:hypothetical protein